MLQWLILIKTEGVSKSSDLKLLLVQNDINVIAKRNGTKTNSQYSLKLTESSNLIYWIQRFTSEQFASENISTFKQG